MPHNDAVKSIVHIPPGVPLLPLSMFLQISGVLFNFRNLHYACTHLYACAQCHKLVFFSRILLMALKFLSGTLSVKMTKQSFITCSGSCLGSRVRVRVGAC